jgi:hypothetical protein
MFIERGVATDVKRRTVERIRTYWAERSAKSKAPALPSQTACERKGGAPSIQTLVPAVAFISATVLRIPMRTSVPTVRIFTRSWISTRRALMLAAVSGMMFG